MASSCRHCFVTSLPSEAKLASYLHHHDNIYPEVCTGLRAAGITQLTIFRVPDTLRLCMYIVTAGPIDLSAATGPGSAYRAVPRCKEWEELMDSSFHGGWIDTEEVHSSDVQWNTALSAPMQASRYHLTTNMSPLLQAVLSPASEDVFKTFMAVIAKLRTWPAQPDQVKREQAQLRMVDRLLGSSQLIAVEDRGLLLSLKAAVKLAQEMDLMTCSATDYMSGDEIDWDAALYTKTTELMLDEGRLTK